MKGPLLQGEITSKLNTAYLVVLQLPASSLAGMSSTGLDGAAVGVAPQLGWILGLIAASSIAATIMQRALLQQQR